MPRTLFTPKEFLDVIRQDCVERHLDEKRINARLLLYLVEKGILYPVRERSKEYERKKYSQIDLRVMQLLLRDIAGPGNGKRSIIKSVVKLSERINNYNLLDRLKPDKSASVEMDNNRVVLKESYKRIVTRVSELGYEGRDKTNILGVRKRDHNIIWIPSKQSPFTRYLFHEVISRIVRSLNDELCIFITTGNKDKILLGLKKRKVDIDKIRYVFALEYQEVEARFRTLIDTLPEEKEKSQSETLTRILKKYVKREALSKGIQLEKVRHCWIVNEANSNFYRFWSKRSDFIDAENKIKDLINKALDDKPATSICIYDKELLFEHLQRKGENLLENVAEVVGTHDRMYLLDAASHMHSGPRAMRELMRWIATSMESDVHGIPEKAAVM